MEGIDITPFKNEPRLADALRLLARSNELRPSANQLLSAIGESCVADEDVTPEGREAALRQNARTIERLAEEILRVASQPRRGLI
jgi:hypothetical protein